MSRRFLEGLSKQGIKPQNLLFFPNHLMVQNWNSTELVFRLMVDALNGDDNNDGFTWATAKKTIQAAVDFLPNDMQGHRATILVHSGSYGPVIVDKKNAEEITFFWCGSVFNNSNHSRHIWFRNGAVNPFRDNNQIIIASNDATIPLITAGANSNYYFSSFDENFNAWVVGYGYSERWVLQANGASGSCYGGYGNKNTVSCYIFSMKFDMKNAIWYGAEIHNNTYFTQASFYGGAGSGSTGTGQWRGAIAGGGDVSAFFFIGGGFGFHASYPLPGSVYLYIEDVAQAYSNQNDSAKGMNLSPVSIKYVQNASAFAKSNIWLGSNFAGHMKYDPTYFTLQDTSIAPRIIEDSLAGTLKTYITENLYDDGTNLNYKGTNIIVP